VVVAGLLFGGGIAVGIALPIGNSGGTSVSTDQGGFPGGGEQGTRPTSPRGDSNQTGPSAPNSGETDTQDTEQG